MPGVTEKGADLEMECEGERDPVAAMSLYQKGSSINTESETVIPTC